MTICMSEFIDVKFADLQIVVNGALFRNKRFELNKMFQRNASKFAIFYV